MKKTYIKPEIMFENFSLSTNIAGNCEVIVNTQNDDTCGYLPDRDPTGKPIFSDKMTGCERTEADGNYNGICYHVPTETNNLFNS